MVDIMSQSFLIEFPMHDPTLVPFGYAEGWYLCRCGLCGENFEGDKRARACKPCATLERDEYNREVYETKFVLSDN